MRKKKCRPLVEMHALVKEAWPKMRVVSKQGEARKVKQIAKELKVAPSTIRTHARKLGLLEFQRASRKKKGMGVAELLRTPRPKTLPAPAARGNGLDPIASITEEVRLMKSACTAIESLPPAAREYLLAKLTEQSA
jgi:hypothetical protein